VICRENIFNRRASEVIFNAKIAQEISLICGYSRLAGSVGMNLDSQLS